MDTSAPGPIELGLDTFGDVTLAGDGSPLSQAQVLRHVVEEAVVADQAGLYGTRVLPRVRELLAGA